MSAGPAGGPSSVAPALAVSPESAIEELNALESRQNSLRRDEAECKETLGRLEREKDQLVRTLQRLAWEDESQFFREGHIFKDRYQLLRLLGRGGFSEVFLVRTDTTAAGPPPQKKKLRSRRRVTLTIPGCVR